MHHWPSWPIRSRPEIITPLCNPNAQQKMSRLSGNAARTMVPVNSNGRFLEYSRRFMWFVSFPATPSWPVARCRRGRRDRTAAVVQCHVLGKQEFEQPPPIHQFAGQPWRWIMQCAHGNGSGSELRRRRTRFLLAKDALTISRSKKMRRPIRMNGIDLAFVCIRSHRVLGRASGSNRASSNCSALSSRAVSLVGSFMGSSRPVPPGRRNHCRGRSSALRAEHCSAGIGVSMRTGWGTSQGSTLCVIHIIPTPFSTSCQECGFHMLDETDAPVPSAEPDW